jgi:transmembrane sensor
MQNENPSQLDAEAAEWLVELRDPENDGADAESRALQRETAFLEWLERSPQHLTAFAGASRAFATLDQLGALNSIDVRQLIHDHSNAVIPLYPTPSEYSKGPADTPARTGFLLRSALVLAACLALVAVGVAFMRTHATYRDYVTAVGEQRTLRLDDGSIVHLNTDTHARVYFTTQVREVDLLKGEALFEVVERPIRPFIVNTGSATIRDLGTTFDVYKHADDATTVAVIEGAVQVAVGTADVTTTPAASPIVSDTGPTRLAAGEQASVVNGLVVKESKPDVSRALAWRNRTLSFSGAALAEVATEFNRYNKIQIRVEGDAVRKRQISGVFSADHPQSVLLFLAKDETLSVIPEGDSWVVRAR